MKSPINSSCGFCASVTRSSFKLPGGSGGSDLQTRHPERNKGQSFAEQIRRVCRFPTLADVGCERTRFRALHLAKQQQVFWEDSRRARFSSWLELFPVCQFSENTANGCLSRSRISVNELRNGHPGSECFENQGREIRVPRIRGLPPRCSGSATMKLMAFAYCH